MAWVLCSKSDVVDFYPVPESELKDSWSDYVEQLISEHLQVRNLVTPVTYTDEVHSGDGSKVLNVNNPPIYGTTFTIKLWDTAIDTSDIVVMRNFFGRQITTWDKGSFNYKITYQSGYDWDTSPPYNHQIIRGTCAEMISKIHRFRHKGGSQQSFAAERATEKFGADNQNIHDTLDSSLHRTMKRNLRKQQVRVR